MSKSYSSPENDHTVMLSLTPGIGYDFNSPEAIAQRYIPKPVPGGPPASKKWNRPTMAELLTFLLPWWHTIFVTSCVLAVLFDPLFFYIPFIDSENKCMGIDKKVRLAALISRSLTDITFVVHIIWQLYEASKFAASKVRTRELKLQNTARQLIIDSDAYEWSSRGEIIEFAKAFSHKLSWRSFITDLLAVFPMPQLLIVGFFFEMRGPNYLNNRKVLDVFVLAQYVPRIYRIHLSCKNVKGSTALWIKGAFNFFLYILASHVLGAFWYFFSIQRETSCWYQNCMKNSETAGCYFFCHDSHGRNITFINSNERNMTFINNMDEYCLINIPYNMADPPFDFGIFLDSLKNKITEHINFSEKLGYCFWWGLRNLSNFGTNLTASPYLWENCFAILISIVGLLLFLYLIGNVQIYMERATTRSEEIREKIQTKKKDIEKWMDKNELHDDMKEEIMENIKKKLEEDINADLENIFSLLPWYTKKALKRVLCMSTLTNVPMLRKLDEKVLKMICDYLKPVNYTENTIVFQMGEPLDRMVFITEGFMWTYTTASESSHAGKLSTLATSPSMDTNFLKKGDFYGSELLQFASSSLTLLPTSAANVRCHTNVEAFVLMAKDLRSVVTKCEKWWPFDYDASKDEAADRVAPLPPPVSQPTGSKKRVTRP